MLFQALGVKPVLWRVLVEDENPVDVTAGVLPISLRFGQRRFNGDRNIIGQTLRAERLDKTVIGVMPGFLFGPSRFLDPSELDPHGDTEQIQSTQYGMGLVARLKPEVALKQAQAELTALASQQAAADPGRNKNWGAVVQLGRNLSIEARGRRYCCFKAAVGIVLLFRCADVAGLLLAHAASRGRRSPSAPQSAPDEGESFARHMGNIGQQFHSALAKVVLSNQSLSNSSALLRQQKSTVGNKKCCLAYCPAKINWQQSGTAAH